MLCNCDWYIYYCINLEQIFKRHREREEKKKKTKKNEREIKNHIVASYANEQIFTFWMNMFLWLKKEEVNQKLFVIFKSEVKTLIFARKFKKSPELSDYILQSISKQKFVKSYIHGIVIRKRRCTYIA